MRSGLIGVWYGEADFTRPKQADRIRSLEFIWDERNGHGREWSARWEGVIIAPTNGNVSFHAETSQHITLEIDGKQVLQVGDEQREAVGTFPMTKKAVYSMKVRYAHQGGHDGYFHITWSWKGLPKTAIPPENLCHTATHADFWGWEPMDITDMPPVDRSAFITVPARHVFVYKASGRFAGWPANGGIWQWDNEILIAFHEGAYEYNDDGHSIDRDQPQRNLLARSLDGGETWKIEAPENLDDDEDKIQPRPDQIDFAHPDFAMRCDGDLFHTSYDRGKTWYGPYPLLEIGRDLTARTDYIINDSNDCLFFMSAKEGQVQAGLQDRAFCAQTTDRGKTIHFLSWMTEDVSVRSVMPSTSRISENHLVSAMRRRKDIRREDRPEISQNWMDIYESPDNGETWHFLSKIADTDRGGRNGNPPSMVRLKDGRLCVTYGYRSFPFGIRAKLSVDNGKTWSDEIHLRDDGRSWDIEYTRTIERLDGKLVTIYYYTTAENPEQHIAATIWMTNLIKPTERRGE